MRFLQFLAALLVSAPALAANSSWDKQWSECKDLRLLQFQSRIEGFRGLMQEGEAWEQGLAQQQAQVSRLANETCKQWAENPNGDEPLKQFVKEYSSASQQALELKNKADSLLVPQMQTRWKQVAEELAPYNYKFENFRCGKAFLRMQKHIKAQVQLIESGFTALKLKCPKAAEKVIADAVAQRKASAPLPGSEGGIHHRVPSTKPDSSSITGTEEAIRNNQKAAPLVE